MKSKGSRSQLFISWVSLDSRSHVNLRPQLGAWALLVHQFRVQDHLLRLVDSFLFLVVLNRCEDHKLSQYEANLLKSKPLHNNEFSDFQRHMHIIEKGNKGPFLLVSLWPRHLSSQCRKIFLWNPFKSWPQKTLLIHLAYQRIHHLHHSNVPYFAVFVIGGHRSKRHGSSLNSDFPLSFLII